MLRVQARPCAGQPTSLIITPSLFQLSYNLSPPFLLYHHYSSSSTPSPIHPLTHPLWVRGPLLWGGSQLDYQASVAVSTWLVEDELRQSTQSILSLKKTRLKGGQLHYNWFSRGC